MSIDDSPHPQPQLVFAELMYLCVCVCFVFFLIQVPQQPSLQVTLAPAAVPVVPLEALTTMNTYFPLRPSTRCDVCHPILPSIH